MKFLKNQFKKTNRGLVLAALLVIGVAIFTLIDNINFKEEKPEIEQLISSYIREMGEFSVTPEELTTKTEISDEEFKPYQDNFNEFVNKYWVYKKKNQYASFYGPYMSDTKEMYSDLQYNNNKDNHIVSATYEARNIKVRKAGPSCATATFELYIVIETVGNPYFLTPHYPESPSWTEDNKELAGQKKKYKLSGEYQATLERTSDGWKLYETGGFISSSEEISIAE